METFFTYNTPHLVAWDWMIAVDLFLGGIGAGAFVVAALTSLYYKDKFPQVSKIGAVLAPICVIVGNLFLVAEVGRPERIYRTIIGFNVSSPLSWGGPIQALIIAVGLVYAWMWFKPVSTKARNTVAIIGIPIALLVGTYHGWLLSMVTARPLWNTGPATVGALMAIATTGIAGVLLVVCLLGKQVFDTKAALMVHDLRKVLVVGLVLQCVTLFVWWISLYYGSIGGREALATANAAIGPLFWIVGIVAGLAVPALIQFVEILKQPKDTVHVNLPLMVLTAALVLVGGFVFRYAVLIGGQLS